MGQDFLDIQHNSQLTKFISFLTHWSFSINFRSKSRNLPQWTRHTGHLVPQGWLHGRLDDGYSPGAGAGLLLLVRQRDLAEVRVHAAGKNQGYISGMRIRIWPRKRLRGSVPQTMGDFEKSFG